MTFERFFRIASYTAVFCGFGALWISGTFSFVAGGLFPVVIVCAWLAEGTRWQIGERPGTALIVLCIPLYFAGWRGGFASGNTTVTALPGLLGLLILTLTGIKLLQRKSDRDWIFLYLMAFFQVLLAAGLSISSLYLAVFVVYIFTMVCSVILLEMRRTRRAITEGSHGRIAEFEESNKSRFRLRRVPAAAVVLIFFILAAAVPMFFMLPRVGGAGTGGNSAAIATYSGFSDSVRLGEIGMIQERDEVVLRARLEGPQVPLSRIRWRGVALDTFDNLSWSKSDNAKEARPKGDREMVQVDYASGRDSLPIQTIYLEPIDSPVIFALPRPVGVQGNFQILFRDKYGALSFPRPAERITYRVVSDITTPPAETLRQDKAKYSPADDNFLQLPDDLDPRIGRLAADITKNTANRYEASAAIESYLQNEYGYTLERKATGNQPLADFLFNVREGHCEYFSTAMAIMLRTRGIAARVINGFQRGEYNETADAYIVRQRNAHSWVEVYFPGENAWVTFDPTPFAGRESTSGSAGIATSFNGYVQALETFWIQYFVAFDNQEQRTLFTSLRWGMADAGGRSSAMLSRIQAALGNWWTSIRGDNGFEARLHAASSAFWYITAIAFLLAIGIMAAWSLKKYDAVGRLRSFFGRRREGNSVEFYDRMQKVLSRKGIRRDASQTPIEFAATLGMPEAVMITQMYNGVRFGDQKLTGEETETIENWLEGLEKGLS
ncbi:MAG: transglutaminase TgpA family protein [Pyrinomonadaceae bacterium]